MLADRARTPLILAALALVASAGVAALSFSPCRAPAASILVMSEPPASGPSVEITDFCPPHVRAAMHLGDDAILYCVRGQFPEPGTFVFAQYRTTETWERFAVVADNGELIVPMLDRPRSR
jgi:hypothetical protein